MKLRQLILGGFLLLFSAVLTGADIHLFPLFPGEMIFEPFCSPQLTYLDYWKIAEGKDSKFNIKSGYGANSTLLSTSNAQKACATMSRTYKDFPCSGYDSISVLFKGIGISEGIKFTLSARTDKGEVSASKLCGKRKEPVEIILDLQQAKFIKEITLKVEAPEAKKGAWSFYLYYMALHNNNDYAAYKRYLENLGKIDWDKLIKPESYQPKFKPQYGLYFKDDKELADYRKYCKSYDRYKFLESKAQYLAEFPLEKLVDKQMFIDALAAQRRQELGLHPGQLLWQVANMGTAAALITENKAALRKAAKLAVVLAVIDSVGEMGEMSNLIGTTLDRTGFTESEILASTAEILDFAGEMFTRTGRDYVLKCMAKKAIGSVNYSAWVYEFAYHSNQMAVFNKGRMAIYLIFEKLGYKHIIPYTDAAMNELNISMDNCFEPDGGNMESTGYMMWTLGTALSSYSMYAQVRGKTLAEVLPPNLLKSDSWANCIVSTSDRAGVISIGQAPHWKLHAQVSAFMAAALPQSQWTRIFNKYPGKAGLKDVGYWFEQKFYAWKHSRNVPEKNPELKAFVETKSNGLAVSHRKLNGEIVKLLVLGYAYHVGKRQDDIGSFVLECAGDSFFIDPAYYAGYYARPEFHNVLEPVMKDKNDVVKPNGFYQLWYYKTSSDLIPKASGDEKSFSARINLKRLWPRRYFKKNVRTINSPTPDVIEVSDDYVLGSGAQAVEFNLQCILPVKVEGNTITVSGKKADAVVTVPSDCTIETEKYKFPAANMKEMELGANDSLTRIIIRRKGEKGVLKVKIQLKLH